MDQSLMSVMKSIGDAIKLDSGNNYEEAYVKYLESTLRITSNLLHSVRAGGQVAVTREVRRHVQLGQQCLGRVADLLDQISQGEGQKAGSAATTPTSAPVYSISPEQMFLSYGRHTGPSPLEVAYRQNQQLMAAYKARLARMNRRHPNTVNMSLTLQRKMVENLAIAKAQEDALARKLHERQTRLEEQAARRFSTPTGLSKEDQFQRETYKRILDFEQDNTRLIQLRKKLEENSGEETLINQLVQEILACQHHPLSEMLQRQRYEILQELTPLVSSHFELLSRITVPLPPDLWPSAVSSPSEEKNSEVIQEVLRDNLKEQEEVTGADGTDSELKDWRISSDDNLPETSESAGGGGASGMGVHDSEESGVPKNLCPSYIGDASVTDGIAGATSQGNGIPPGESDGDSRGDEDRKVPASETLNEGESSSRNDEGENGFDSAVLSTRRNVAAAIDRGSELTEKLTGENQETRRILRQISHDYEKYNQENMDDLFEDSEEEGVDSESEKPECERAGVSAPQPTGMSSGSSRPQLAGPSVKFPGGIWTPSDPKDRGSSCAENATASTSSPNLLLCGISEEKFQKHLSEITSIIHRSCEQLQVMFIIAYQQLDTPEAREQVYASLEEHIFKPVWKYLLPLFRLANLRSELHLAHCMTQYSDPRPSDFSVQPKLQLEGGGKGGGDQLGQAPYQSAVEELSRLKNYYTFLSKLECVVRVCRQVCTCVTEYYGASPDSEAEKSAPSIGADDLLPILTYVAVRTKEPQLYAECLAMEEFIHEGYLMCEEGYCLTTLQTAINFMTKHEQSQ